MLHHHLATTTPSLLQQVQQNRHESHINHSSQHGRTGDNVEINHEGAHQSASASVSFSSSLCNISQPTSQHAIAAYNARIAAGQERSNMPVDSSSRQSSSMNQSALHQSRSNYIPLPIPTDGQAITAAQMSGPFIVPCSSSSQPVAISAQQRQQLRGAHPLSRTSSIITDESHGLGDQLSLSSSSSSFTPSNPLVSADDTDMSDPSSSRNEVVNLTHRRHTAPSPSSSSAASNDKNKVAESTSLNASASVR